MKILVPVDGSPASLRAVKLAVDHVSARSEATLVLMNVQNFSGINLLEGAEIIPSAWIEQEEKRAAAEALKEGVIVQSPVGEERGASYDHAQCLCGLVALCAAGSSQAAQATEPTGTLTLACQGTSTLIGKDVLTTQVSAGIIVNFADRTVAFGGYPEAGDFPTIKIIGISEVAVFFFGGSVPGRYIRGSIDRVTGDVEATSEAADTENRITSSTLYALKCKPTQRMF